MADFNRAWDLEPRELLAEAAQYRGDVAFPVYELAMNAKNALAVASATEQLGKNITTATSELVAGIAEAATTVAEAGRAQERYARNLAFATWALVGVTAALFLATLWGS